MADKEDYIYAAARIRFKEMQCLSAAFIETLMAARNGDEALRLLADKGWGDGVQPIQSVLEKQRKDTWALLRELVKDMSVFDTFLLSNDYHNLKAAVKKLVSPAESKDIYIDDCTVAPALFEAALANGEYSALPQDMQQPARLAMAAIRQTHDGQLCDIIVDRACIEAVVRAGAGKGEVIELYAETLALVSSVKTAWRAALTGKDRGFLMAALPDCPPLDKDKLVEAALKGTDAILEYLRAGAYSKGGEMLAASVAAFEKWCDNRLISKISIQKTNTMTINPLAAYLIAKENEIKTVRVILSGKHNDLSENLVRERLRDMYV